jgi:two-component system response regulator YesN
MDARFTAPLPMNEVAQKAGCSRAHLFLVFKRETGMSPNDWLQRHRVKAASQLLRTTDRKLEDIAATVGFSSAQYFCQVFRKYTGKTPGEHRAS